MGVLGRRTIVPVAGKETSGPGKVGAGERRGVEGPRGCPPLAFLCISMLILVSSISFKSLPPLPHTPDLP